MRPFFTLQLIGGFFILLSQALPLKMYGQDTHRSASNGKPNAAELLCHVWNISKDTDTSGVFMGAMLSYSHVSTLRFDRDGYLVFNNGASAEGVWNYDVFRQQMLFIIGNRLWKFSVLALTGRLLVLENTQRKPGVKIVLWRAEL